MGYFKTKYQYDDSQQQQRLFGFGHYYRLDALGKRAYLLKYHYVAYSETTTCVNLKSPVSL